MPTGRKPPPTASREDRLAYLVPAVLASQDAVELFHEIVVVVGDALGYGRADAQESGRRLYALQILAMLRKFAPERSQLVIAPRPVPEGRGKAKVPE